jgi:hypothetical protein
MGNLDLYEKVRVVPKEAQKSITGGRLKGMTDINPMWRIKMLTEQFGMCGVGWYYKVTNQWMVDHGEETAAFVMLDLFVKENGEWSQPISGVGGSMFASKEKNGVYVDDECFKKATTDAISVACKQLGIGADIYWAKDSTKYTTAADIPTQRDMNSAITETEYKEIAALVQKANVNEEKLKEQFKVQSLIMLSYAQYSALKNKLEKAIAAKES